MQHGCTNPLLSRPVPLYSAFSALIPALSTPHLPPPSVHALKLKPGWWSEARTAVRWWAGAPWRADFQRVVVSDQSWQHLIAARTECLRPLIRCYIDRRYPVWHRQRMGAADFLQAGGHFTPEDKRALAQGRHSELLALPEGFSLCLGLNDLHPEEGLWTLALRNAQQARVYQLSFGFCPSGSVLVGSVQGGKRSADFEPDVAIKALTKLCHGLRPQTLLVHALTALASRWACRDVRFVDPRYQAKSRWHRPPRHIRFDYGALFEELGMARLPHGHWRAPATLPRRPLSEVDARKRAQYRRRYDMLDGLREALQRR